MQHRVEEAMVVPGSHLVSVIPVPQTNAYESEDRVLSEYPSTQSSPGYKCYYKYFLIETFYFKVHPLYP